MSETLFYSGKAKDVFTTDDQNVLRMVYKDQATALNGKRKEQITGKGLLNYQISKLIFKYLMANGIETHLIENISATEQLVKKVTIVPLEVVLRNVVAGSFARKFGQAPGKRLATPIIEYYYKNDALDDPAINISQATALAIVTPAEIEVIEKQTKQINQLLIDLFDRADIDLIDFKLEFGRYDGRLILADEFSPDNCRLWDQTTHESLDKDVFRLNKGDLVSVYDVVLRRLEKILGGSTDV